MTTLAHPVTRRVLRNGMRVVLNAGYPTPRAAVSLHIGVGFRDEGLGEEGMAHLFEHLMFRGSVSLPGGTFGNDVYDSGGSMSGTTHHDYTDYLQVIPAANLRQALFRDAERLRAPKFEEAELALQLDGIAQEVAHARDIPPLGGFPWPLISRVISSHQQFSHDGYGDVEHLRTVTLADCRTFFKRHYAPSNVVLTVVCPQSVDEVMPWIEEEFSRVPPRPKLSVERPVERPPENAGGERWTSPGLESTSTSVAFRIPDPCDDLNKYLAHVVLADLLERETAGIASGSRIVSARCGIFGMLDTKDPDVLVITVGSKEDKNPSEMANTIVGAIQGIARRASPRDVADAATRMSHDVARRQSDLGTWCRTLGRLEYLLGDPTVAVELPDRLANVTANDVSAAASEVARQPPRWVSVGPGQERTRPSSTAGPSLHAVPKANPERVSSVEEARPLPPRHRVTAVPPLHASEFRTSSGVRVVAARDLRAVLCEVRLRMPLGPRGWESQGLAASVWRRALTASGIADVRRLPGVVIDARVTGQWADVSGSCPRESLEHVVRVLSRALQIAAVDTADDKADPYMPQNHEQLLNDVLRIAWAPPMTPNAPLLCPANATIVIVGADPEYIAESVGCITNQYPLLHVGIGTVDPPKPFITAISGISADLPAGGPKEEYVELLMSGPETFGGAGEPAKYLATALLGGSPGSRLSEWCRRFERRVVDMSVGRDLIGPHPRAYIRIRTPVRLADESLTMVRRTIDALSDQPPSMAELGRIAGYAHAQLLSSFDSPGFLADALRHTLSAGRTLDWVLGRSSALLATRPEDVSEAVSLFENAGHTVVSLGRFDGESLKRLTAAWHPA